MSVEFWFRLGSYYLGIISVLALIFALIESSRQFEHTKKWQPLVAAFGFFLVIVSLLIETVLLDNESLTTIIVLCQIVGFFGISLGLHGNKPADSFASSDIVTGRKAATSEGTFDWINLLATPLTNKAAQTVQVKPAEEKPPKAASPEPAKNIKKDVAVDLSYLSNRPRKKTYEPVTESRKEILNDLFPIENSKKSKKSAVLPFGLGAVQLFAISPFITLVIIASIILGLIPRRQVTGNTPILFGFCILLIVWMSRVIIDPVNLTDTMSLAIQAVETIGFAFIGFGSWIKIKGEASHHFASILVSTTIGLMVTTTALGYYYVNQSDTLQLLLYFCTGVLIVIIPVIHATIFDHLPEQRARTKQ